MELKLMFIHWYLFEQIDVYTLVLSWFTHGIYLFMDYSVLLDLEDSSVNK